MPAIDNLPTEIVLDRSDPFKTDLINRLSPLGEALFELLKWDKGDGRETSYYKWMAANGRFIKGDVDTIVEHRKLLVQRIVYEGYEEKAWLNSKNSGPPRITIDAQGILHCYDGTHRTGLLSFLGIPIKTQVFDRADKWVERISKTYYTPIPHPDLKGKKPVRFNSSRYFAIAQIMKRLGVAKVIDAGSALGFGTTILSDQGFRICGIERDPDYYDMASTWARLSGRSITYHLSSAQEYPHWKWGEALLFLSILHHMATSVEEITGFFKTLVKPKVVFVELPSSSDRRWHKAFREKSDEDPQGNLLRIIKETLGFQNQEEVYCDPSYEGRVTWAFT